MAMLESEESALESSVGGFVHWPGYENIRFISIDSFHLLVEYEVGDLKICICFKIIP